MQRTRRKVSVKNKKETSAGESGNNPFELLSQQPGEHSGGENETMEPTSSAASSSVISEKDGDLNNSPIKLDSVHAIQLQEQIKNVIRSEPILDQLVALIADTIVGQVTQHV